MQEIEFLNTAPLSSFLTESAERNTLLRKIQANASLLYSRAKEANLPISQRLTELVSTVAINSEEQPESEVIADTLLMQADLIQNTVFVILGANSAAHLESSLAAPFCRELLELLVSYEPAPEELPSTASQLVESARKIYARKPQQPKPIENVDQ